MEEQNITIRYVANDGIALLVYISDADGMIVEFVDVATTQDVNTCWHNPVIT